MTSAESRRAPLLGALLVGGRSRRMGRDKAALPHPGGGTLLQHALDLLGAVCAQRALCGDRSAVGTADVSSPDAGDADAHPPKHSAPLRLPDPVADRGPAVGLAEALRVAVELNLRGVLVLPVDMPGVTLDDLRTLVGSWQQHPQQIAAAVFPVTAPPAESCSAEPIAPRPEPLVAIYPTGYAAAIAQLAASTQRSLARWLATEPHQTVPLPATSAPNVNTPTDWQRFMP